MPNKNYINGRAKEYREAKKLREQGYLVVRSAGSHSPIDLVAIKWAGDVYPLKAITDAKIAGTWKLKEGVFPLGEIKFIQCKVGESSEREKKKVLDGGIKKFEGFYSATVEVV